MFSRIVSLMWSSVLLYTSFDIFLICSQSSAIWIFFFIIKNQYSLSSFLFRLEIGIIGVALLIQIEIRKKLMLPSKRLYFQCIVCILSLSIRHSILGLAWKLLPLNNVWIPKQRSNQSIMFVSLLLTLPPTGRMQREKFYVELFITLSSSASSNFIMIQIHLSSIITCLLHTGLPCLTSGMSFSWIITLSYGGNNSSTN